MTVRVNKSAFNIREKLSELERPIGVKGNELMRAETAQEAGALLGVCLLYTSPSPRDYAASRMPSSA